jgi:hypothetical protein
MDARNNLANQEVFKMARGVDPRGDRTVGIITKCDVVQNGDEAGVSNHFIIFKSDIELKFGIRSFESHKILSKTCSTDGLRFVIALRLRLRKVCR